MSNDTLISQTEVTEGYTFKFGYASFDEKEFMNPAYLRVYKKEQLIYTDTFSAQGEMYLHSLGHHQLSGDKLFFTLFHGIEACDYIQSTRYYFISPAEKVHYLCDFTQVSNEGYSTKSFEHRFLEDKLSVVESLVYHEKDQKDLFDTVNIVFNGDAFKIDKGSGIFQ